MNAADHGCSLLSHRRWRRRRAQADRRPHLPDIAAERIGFLVALPFEEASPFLEGAGEQRLDLGGGRRAQIFAEDEAFAPARPDPPPAALGRTEIDHRIADGQLGEDRPVRLGVQIEFLGRDIGVRRCGRRRRRSNRRGATRRPPGRPTRRRQRRGRNRLERASCPASASSDRGRSRCRLRRLSSRAGFDAASRRPSRRTLSCR